jgi:uncharacterized membrane protein YfcA
MLTIILGISVGLALGLTGAGGGILAIPALTLGLGWSLQQATPVALCAVGMAASLGAVHGLRNRLVRYKAAGVMAVAGWLVAPLGLAASKWFPAKLLMILFAVVMVFVAYRLYRQAASLSHGPSNATLQKNCMMNSSTGRLQWNVQCITTLALIGAGSGFLTGLLGVGGGFLVVPAFRRFSNVHMHSVVATSLTVVALVSLGALLHMLTEGERLAEGAVVFIAATLAGMAGGRMVAANIPAARLQKGFAGLCLGVALLVLFNTCV